MAKSYTNPRSGKYYIPNYIINGRKRIGFEELIKSGKHFIINIFPEDFADRKADSAPNSEYNRRAGIGKSELLNLSVKVFYKSYHVKDTREIPVIDFSSSNFNTRAGILVNILIALCALDSDLEEEYFKRNKADVWGKMTDRFPEIVGKERQDAPGEDDPSHVAATWFEELTKDLHKQYFAQKKGGRPLLFFDSFDEQYVGSSEVALHRWLVNTLFPWLAGVMQVSLVIAGREQLEIKNPDIKKLIQRVELHRFDQSQVKAYFEKYFEENKSPNPEKPYPPLPGSSDTIWKKITDLTDGKPIFIDFVCDLAKRDFNTENHDLAQSLGRMYERAKSKDLSDQQKSFKTHLINRLHLRDPRKKDSGKPNDKDSDIYFRAEVIRILSVAKHGLDHEQYQQVRDGFKNEPKVAEVKHYFQNTFTTNRLPYVKNRGDARLLHDEISELLQEYHWEVVDPERIEYNKSLHQIIRLYEEQLLSIKTQTRYSRLLEYIEYRFSFRDRKEETAAVNRYLYEFSQHLDDFPDLCSRLNAKARYYYTLKKNDFDTGAKPNTLSLEHDFPLLAKIPMRTVEYLLTERTSASKDWDTLLKKYLEEVEGHISVSLTNEQQEVLKNILEASLITPPKILLTHEQQQTLKEVLDLSLTMGSLANNQKQALKNILHLSLIGSPKVLLTSEQQRIIKEVLDLLSTKVPLSYEQKQALEARLLSAEGEMLLWKNEWEKGEAKIREAKELFYRTGDSHAQVWCEHLLGFEKQRRADFTRAMEHHQAAINEAITSLLNLCDEPDTFLNNPNHYANHYRLRLLVKVLSRAGSNTAINYRYRGRVVDGVKALQGFRSMAEITGGREELRLDINQKILEALQWKILNFNEEDEKSTLFQDPLLPRRLTFAKLIYELRQIGGEDRYYRMTNQDFDAEQLKKNKDTARMEEAREKLQKEFSPLPPPLTYPGLNWKPAEITQPYEAVRSRIPVNRENAELYYQFGGRVVLSTKYSPDGKQSYFEVARIAYENALTVAREAGFEFLVMQALESSCRLHYLTGNTGELERCIHEFEKKNADLKSRGYAPYHDLLSKYWLTRGDRELQILDGQHLSADGKPTAVEAYVEMLLHAVQHNQFLYHLILEIFASRVKTIFSRMPHSEIMNFKRAILRTVETSDLINKDKRFLNYLGWLFQAVTLHRDLGHKEEEVLSDIKKGIQRLMRRGEFIKAGTINKFLIEHYEDYSKGDDKKENLAHRLYQQVYIYQGANKHSKVKELLSQMLKLSELCDKKNNPLHPAHVAYDIAKAVHLYRTADIWIVERFILGELELFRQDKQKGSKGKELFEESRILLEDVINTMSGHLNSLDRPNQKLYAEALFRLGELYILSGEEGKNFTKRFATKLDGLKAYLLKEEKGKAELKKADERSLVDGKLSPAIYTLNLAYLYARHIGDNHRDTDALQSIANALYFAGESRHEAGRTRILQKIKEKVIQKCKDERQEGIYRYPVVAAKMHLAEGDIYFSELFELKPDRDGTIEAKVRKGQNHDQRETKALLHRMMWAYLSALSRLADPNKVYQNFHFDNMLLEINRRILLIPDHAMIKMLKEGLPAAWNLFRELQERKEPLKSIETELALHEVSLKVKAILTPSS